MKNHLLATASIPSQHHTTPHTAPKKTARAARRPAANGGHFLILNF